MIPWEDLEEDVKPEQCLLEGELWTGATAQSPIAFDEVISVGEMVQESLGEERLLPRHLALAIFAHPAVKAEIGLVGCDPEIPETRLREAMLARLSMPQTSDAARSSECGVLEFKLACWQSGMVRYPLGEADSMVDPMDLLARIMLLANVCEDIAFATSVPLLEDFRVHALFNRHVWSCVPFYLRNPYRFPTAAEIRESLRFAPYVQGDDEDDDEDEDEVEDNPRSVVWLLVHGERFNPKDWEGWPRV